MSGFNTPRAEQTAPQPKQMSNRLMTMKFMQRAVAHTDRPQSLPTTPSSEPPYKRQKTDSSTPGSATRSPGFERSAFLDRKAITAAVKAEAATQALARARHLGEHGIETEWVLPVSIPHTAKNGSFAETADEDEFESEDEEADIWSTAPSGRQTYGSFKRKKRVSMPKSSAGVVDNAATLPPAHGSVSDEFGSDSESGEISSSSDDEANDRKRKEPTINYENEAEMARLDRMNLSKSSYAKSKASFKPSPKVSFNQRGQSNKGQQHDRNKRGKKGRKTL